MLYVNVCRIKVSVLVVESSKSQTRLSGVFADILGYNEYGVMNLASLVTQGSKSETESLVRNGTGT